MGTVVKEKSNSSEQSKCHDLMVQVHDQHVIPQPFPQSHLTTWEDLREYRFDAIRQRVIDAGEVGEEEYDAVWLELLMPGHIF